MIQCATLQLCTHWSVDIRTFATSTSAQPLSHQIFSSTSLMMWRFTKPLCKLQVNKLQVSGVIILLMWILYPSFKKCFCQIMFSMKSFQWKILCDGLGSYSVIDLARYLSLKQGWACPCLIYFQILSTVMVRDLGRFLDAQGWFGWDSYPQQPSCSLYVSSRRHHDSGAGNHWLWKWPQ